MIETHNYFISNSFDIYIFILVYKSNQIMNEKIVPDRNPVLNWILFNDVRYLFRIFYSQGKVQYPPLAFELFRKVPNKSSQSSKATRLILNLLYCYWRTLAAGFVLTLVCASLNIYISQIFKDFIEVMKEGITSSSIFEVIKHFIILQILRLFFGTHVLKIFSRLAIQVQSSIASKLIQKVVHLSPKQRNALPEGQIYQYENVDIKHISLMTSSLSIIAEWPFTIIVTIYLLFCLNFKLGLIAVFWFIVDLILQRKLNMQRKHCNETKHGLISKRAKLNYEYIQRLREARVSQSQGVIIEKNNDLFLEQCHDHLVFYRYSSMLQILQLLLPLAILCTTLVYDAFSSNTIIFEQLYFVLSLLGTCYQPMSKFRSFYIAWTDAVHSFERIGSFLAKEDDIDNQLYQKVISQSNKYMIIAKKTKATVINKRQQAFTFTINHQIELFKGQRLVIVGRVGQGSTTICRMLAGFASLSQGKIKYSGHIAYLPEEPMYLTDSIFNNIAFFDRSISRDYADKIALKLDLYQYLDASKGLDEQVTSKKYSNTQLKLLSIARILCSNASIYILDSPFSGFTYNYRNKINQQLRQKQKQGVIVIAAKSKTEHLEPRDKVLIIQGGKTIQLGYFKDLNENKKSELSHFIKKHKIHSIQTEEFKALKHIVRQFQNKVRKCMMIELAAWATFKRKKDIKSLNLIVSALKKYSRKLSQQKQAENEQLKKQKKQKQVWKYFIRFITACKVSESFFILVIILVAEMLHTFIHVFIGHEYQHREGQALDSMSHLVGYQVILTAGLAGVIFLEGEVSSYIAIIIGNKLYKKSLLALVSKQMSWYAQRFSLWTADRFNHDYEEIFIFVHQLLSLYKNTIIILITVLLVGGKNYNVILVSIGIGYIYYRIWIIQKVVRSKMPGNFYDLKYDFVKVFNQSVQGHELIKVQRVQEAVIQKAKEKYAQFASFKIIKNKVAVGEDILFSVVGILVTAAALQYGLLTIGDRTSMAKAATSILLLLNLSNVLKSILRTAIACEKFFKLNIFPFMKIAPLEENKSNQLWLPRPSGHKITIKDFLAKDNDERVFEINSFTLTIPQGQTICLYEQDDILRKNLLYALTSNLFFEDSQTNTESFIQIGGVNIKNIKPKDMASLVGVVANSNFMIEGTLEENLKWNNPNYNQKFALQLVKQVNIHQDLKNYSKEKLKTRIEYSDEQTNEGLSRKIAVMRLIMLKTPIIIVADTNPFIDKWSIKDLVQKYNPGCTLIKITNSFDVAFDADRVVLFENLKRVEDGDPKELVKLEFSQIGKLLRMCDKESFIYRYKMQDFRQLENKIQKKELKNYPQVMRKLTQHIFGV